MSSINDLQKSQQQFCAWLRQPKKKSPQGLSQSRMDIYVEVVQENIKGFINVAYPISQNWVKQSHWKKMVKAFMAYHYAQSPFFYEIADQFRQFLLTEQAQHHLTFLSQYAHLNELLHYEYLEMVIHRNHTPWQKRKGTKLKDALQQPQLFQVALNTSVWLMVYHYPVYTLNEQSTKKQIKNLTVAPSAVLFFKDAKQRLTWQLLNPVQAQILDALLNDLNTKPVEFQHFFDCFHFTIFCEQISKSDLQQQAKELLQILQRHKLLHLITSV